MVFEHDTEVVAVDFELGASNVSEATADISLVMRVASFMEWSPLLT